MSGKLVAIAKGERKGVRRTWLLTTWFGPAADPSMALWALQ